MSTSSTSSDSSPPPTSSDSSPPPASSTWFAKRACAQLEEMERHLFPGDTSPVRPSDPRATLVQRAAHLVCELNALTRAICEPSPVLGLAYSMERTLAETSTWLGVCTESGRAPTPLLHGARNGINHAVYALCCAFATRHQNIGTRLDPDTSYEARRVRAQRVVCARYRRRARLERALLFETHLAHKGQAAVDTAAYAIDEDPWSELEGGSAVEGEEDEAEDVPRATGFYPPPRLVPPEPSAYVRDAPSIEDALVTRSHLVCMLNWLEGMGVPMCSRAVGTTEATSAVILHLLHAAYEMRGGFHGPVDLSISFVYLCERARCVLRRAAATNAGACRALAHAVDSLYAAASNGRPGYFFARVADEHDLYVRCVTCETRVRPAGTAVDYQCDPAADGMPRTRTHAAGAGAATCFSSCDHRVYSWAAAQRMRRWCAACSNLSGLTGTTADAERDKTQCASLGAWMETAIAHVPTTPAHRRGAPPVRTKFTDAPRAHLAALRARRTKVMTAAATHPDYAIVTRARAQARRADAAAQ